MGFSVTTKLERKTLFSPFVLKLLFIMFFIEFVKGSLLITFLPLYLKSGLGATGLVIGWTLAVQYIGDNLLRTPVGWAIDRIGYRNCMLAGVVMTLISVLLIAFSSNFLLIIVACALLGAGTAPLWPCVIAGATEAADKKAKGTIMSIVYISWLSGAGAGPFVITYFIGISSNAAFRLLIGILIAVVFVSLFLPHRSDEGRAAAGEQENRHVQGDKPPGIERVRSYLSELKRSLNVSWVLFPAMFAQNFALGLLIPVLTIYATEVLHLSLGQFRMFLVAGGAMTVLFMMPVGKLVDRHGKKPFLISGFLLTSAALYMFPFSHSLDFLYVLVSALGLGYALLIPSWNAMIAEAVPPQKRGAIWGLFLTIEGTGTTTGPVASGFLWDSAGPSAPFLASASVLFMLLLLQPFILAKKKSVH